MASPSSALRNLLKNGKSAAQLLHGACNNLGDITQTIRLIQLLALLEDAAESISSCLGIFPSSAKRVLGLLFWQETRDSLGGGRSGVMEAARGNRVVGDEDDDSDGEEDEEYEDEDIEVSDDDDDFEED